MQPMSAFDQDFLAYALLYASEADFELSDEEREYILSKVDSKSFSKSLKEIQTDNDIQRINKIKGRFKHLNYTEEHLKILIDEMFNLFNIDGNYSNLERNLMLGLKRLLKS